MTSFLRQHMTSSPPSSALTHEERIAIVRHHFEKKGYRVHSGLQFGVELVLYADNDLNKVHSDFCVHVVNNSAGRLDWRMLQTLVRSMPAIRKTLIVANVRDAKGDDRCDDDGDNITADRTDAISIQQGSYLVDELAIATEHAPFRHKNIPKGVGTQIKQQSKSK